MYPFNKGMCDTSIIVHTHILFTYFMALWLCRCTDYSRKKPEESEKEGRKKQGEGKEKTRTPRLMSTKDSMESGPCKDVQRLKQQWPLLDVTAIVCDDALSRPVIDSSKDKAATHRVAKQAR